MPGRRQREISGRRYGPDDLGISVRSARRTGSGGVLIHESLPPAIVLAHSGNDSRLWQGPARRRTARTLSGRGRCHPRRASAFVYPSILPATTTIFPVLKAEPARSNLLARHAGQKAARRSNPMIAHLRRESHPRLCACRGAPSPQCPEDYGIDPETTPPRADSTASSMTGSRAMRPAKDLGSRLSRRRPTLLLFLV